MPTSIGPLEITGAALFALAVVHTFSTRYFEHLAHTRTAHAGVWHLLGEVEAVFGFWAIVLVLFIALAYGWGTSSQYLEDLHFTEPMFVFVIMVIAASRPVMQVAAVPRAATPLSPASCRATSIHGVSRPSGCPRNRRLFPEPVAGPAPRFAHHRACGDDACRPDAARADFLG